MYYNCCAFKKFNSISNGEKREAGENPARSRHCDAEQMHINRHCVYLLHGKADASAMKLSQETSSFVFYDRITALGSVINGKSN